MKKARNRKEILELMNTGKATSRQISELNEDDRLYAELLRALSLDNKDSLMDAPEAVIQQAEAIAEKAGLSSAVKSWAARIVLDSWRTPQVAGVRGSAVKSDRRIRIQFGACLLDIRAEKQEGRWHFVGELSDGERRLKDFQLIVTGKKVKRNELGYYEWSSSKAPSQIKVLTDENEVIELPKLSWKNEPNI